MNKRERKKKIMERKMKINKIREKYCTSVHISVRQNAIRER